MKNGSTKSGSFTVGQPVVVLTNRHPDVQAGTEGVIDCVKEDGYGVKIDGLWEVAGTDRGTKVRESRVCWFSELHLKAL